MKTNPEYLKKLAKQKRRANWLPIKRALYYAKRHGSYSEENAIRCFREDYPKEAADFNATYKLGLLDEEYFEAWKKFTADLPRVSSQSEPESAEEFKPAERMSLAELNVENVLSADFSCDPKKGAKPNSQDAHAEKEFALRVTLSRVNNSQEYKDKLAASPEDSKIRRNHAAFLELLKKHNI